MKEDSSKIKHLIIAGTNKAGTTSLFNYLKDHPEICGSYVKQTCFFLDKDYPFAKTNFIHHFDDNPEAYDIFFKDTSSKTKYKLEATPDYMYSPSTSKKIDLFFKDKDLTIIFILRNPIDRFYSWFKYAKQIGEISQETTIGKYIEMNLDENKNSNHMCFHALETGRYKNYLSRFSSQRTHSISYEDLKTNPKQFMVELSNFLTIDENFYEDYSYKIFNETKKVKNTTINGFYKLLKNIYFNTFYKIDFINASILPFLQKISLQYKSYNYQKISSNDVESKEINFLKKYYTNF